jgi:hypothetical protein
MNTIKPTQSYVDQDRAEQLNEKWSPVLDYTSDNVSPITENHTRLNTAILLENQERWCLNEDITAGTSGAFGTHQGTAGSFSGDRYAAGDARLPKILIPMIRRTFPELITNEIVGVQPMSGPVGLAFALRYKYTDEFLADRHIDGKDDPNGDTRGGNRLVGAGNAAAPSYNASGVPGELGYQNLDTRFTGAEEDAFLTRTYTVTYKDANGLLHQVTGTPAELDAAYADSLFVDSDGQDGSVATDNLVPGTDAAPDWTNVAGSTANTDPSTIFRAEDSGVAELLANYELTGKIPQVEVSFEKTSVEAGTRRLGARWSVELEQDVKNMNVMHIETEFTNAMSNEIQAQIDREMLMRMIHVCVRSGQVSAWSPQTSDARWMAERNRVLYSNVIVQANRIAVKNRRGAANFIIATPKVCAIFEMLPEFQWMSVNGNVNTQPTGVARVGNLGGRFNVYRDTRTEAQNLDSNKRGLGDGELNYALLGYKGPEFYDTGIIYCPYIPVMVQRTIGPNDFSPRVGLLTRYGVVDHIFGSELYYHLILVNNIGDGQLFDSNGDGIMNTTYFGM